MNYFIQKATIYVCVYIYRKLSDRGTFGSKLSWFLIILIFPFLVREVQYGGGVR